MISKIEVYVESEDQAKTVADELRRRGLRITGPYYCNGYGAPVNYPRFKNDTPEADYPDGEEG